MLTSIIAVVSLFVGSALAGDPASVRAAEPKTHTIVMEATRFEPADLKISAGDTVVWINKDPFPHTATAKNGEFDSTEIEPGKSWKNNFKTKGDFAYACTLHPTMKGTLKVE